MKNMYDLDISLEILAYMQVRKENELANVADPLQKMKLQQEVDILRAERKALRTDTPLQDAVIYKALNYYGAILKAENAAN
jgi:hypothetical protein